MPVVKSYQKLVCEFSSNEAKSFEDTDSVICAITGNILRDSPELVTELDGGCPDESKLEAAVIRDIDNHRYNYGIFKDELIHKAIDFIYGYGELQRYIDDEDISDIDGMRFNQFSVKRHGIRSKIPVSFNSMQMFDTYCKLLVIRNGGILNNTESCCRVVDVKHRLRISVSVNPGNITGPALSIRKHRRESPGLEDLRKLGMLDEELVGMLRRLAAGDASVIFCGKYAAGKTTLLRAFINSLPEMERVHIIETEAELYPDKPYCIEQQIGKQTEIHPDQPYYIDQQAAKQPELYTDKPDCIKRKVNKQEEIQQDRFCCIEQLMRKHNLDDRTAALKELIRNALTMSMDVYCLGDISGNEALEFIKVAYSGYRGIATTYSDSAGAALDRLFALGRNACITEKDRTIKEMLGKGIDVIFYMKDFKVIEVLEVVGYDGEHDIFDYKRLYLREDGEKSNRQENG